MIYSDNLFNKEIRQSYIDSLSSKQRLTMMCVFLAMLTIIVHLLFQIMYESVMTELLPEFMLPSNFTILFTYNAVSYLFFIAFFIIRYDNMTLSEIGQNKWYMLSKMGYNSTGIIIYKMISSTAIVIMIYSVGFIMAALISTILKYTFVMEYYLPSFAAGAVNTFIVVQLTIVISLYSDTKERARNRLITAIFVNEILKLALGYYGLIRNNILMRDVRNLVEIEHSPYIIIMVSAIILLPIFAYIGAKKKAVYYSLKNPVGGVTIVRYTDNRIIHPIEQKKRRVLSIPGLLAKILLSVVLLASIVFNILILIASLGSSTREFSFFGYIPYVFKSSTMENTIYKNDLAVFKKIDSQYPLNVGDIVLFNESEGNEISIMKIVEINGEEITTDLLKYPVPYTAGSLKETTLRGSIYGIFYAKYRILGAIILFINTFPGRLLTMFVPVILLFFYNQISDYFNRKKKPV
jgi:hypothetical protein